MGCRWCIGWQGSQSHIRCVLICHQKDGPLILRRCIVNRAGVGLNVTVVTQVSVPCVCAHMNCQGTKETSQNRPARAPRGKRSLAASPPDHGPPEAPGKHGPTASQHKKAGPGSPGEEILGGVSPGSWPPGSPGKAWAHLLSRSGVSRPQGHPNAQLGASQGPRGHPKPCAAPA